MSGIIRPIPSRDGGWKSQVSRFVYKESNSSLTWLCLFNLAHGLMCLLSSYLLSELGRKLSLYCTIHHEIFNLAAFRSSYLGTW